MSRKCSISKKRGLAGNNVSHSHLKTRRKQEVNLRSKRFWDDETERFYRIRVSTSIIKTIAKCGLRPTLKKYGLLKEILG